MDISKFLSEPDNFYAKTPSSSFVNTQFVISDKRDHFFIIKVPLYYINFILAVEVNNELYTWIIYMNYI